VVNGEPTLGAGGGRAIRGRALEICVAEPAGRGAHERRTASTSVVLLRERPSLGQGIRSSQQQRTLSAASDRLDLIERDEDASLWVSGGRLTRRGCSSQAGTSARSTCGAIDDERDDRRPRPPRSRFWLARHRRPFDPCTFRSQTCPSGSTSASNGSLRRSSPLQPHPLLQPRPASMPRSATTSTTTMTSSRSLSRRRAAPTSLPLCVLPQVADR